MQSQHDNNKSRKLKVKCRAVATILTFFFSLSALTAQESVNATGGNASGIGGSVSYSVGQVVCQTHSGTNGTVAEGVQQPYEISVITGIEENKGINLSLTAYPNPTSDYLILNINADIKEIHDLPLMSYQLHDMQGKLLQSGIITANHARIATTNLAPAIYFVKVIQRGKVVKTFKIVKNQ
jgi:hypothetical protein